MASSTLARSVLPPNNKWVVSDDRKVHWQDVVSEGH